MRNGTSTARPLKPGSVSAEHDVRQRIVEVTADQEDVAARQVGWRRLGAGTNLKIVSEVLGHKEVAITLDRYSHALPTLHTKAMARLDAMLGRRGATRGRRRKGSDKGYPLVAETDKGSNKGSPATAEANEGPDPSVDRAENGEFGTAYRIRGKRPTRSG